MTVGELLGILRTYPDPTDVVCIEGKNGTFPVADDWARCRMPAKRKKPMEAKEEPYHGFCLLAYEVED
jgi:hypothetical protein